MCDSLTFLFETNHFQHFNLLWRYLSKPLRSGVYYFKTMWFTLAFTIKLNFKVKVTSSLHNIFACFDGLFQIVHWIMSDKPKGSSLNTLNFRANGKALWEKKGVKTEIASLPYLLTWKPHWQASTLWLSVTKASQVWRSGVSLNSIWLTFLPTVQGSHVMPH
mgnify:CR=1 FL=1